VDAVDGDGVIGMYPLVTVDMATPFVYQSQTRAQTAHHGMTPSTMAGFFKFVEGSKTSPIGEPFDCTCATLNLELDQFLF
jgi:uncharacterized protein affecting Mg2+/Co2+ transport